MSKIECFQNIGKRAGKRAGTKDCNTILEMLYQNSITQVSIYDVGKQYFHKFCAPSIVGAMTIWEFKTLESSNQGLQIT